MRNRYTGYTLEQAIEDIKQKGEFTSIRIGAENGSGFIYCGPINKGAILKEADEARRRTLEVISKNLDQFRYVSSGLPETVERRVCAKTKNMHFKPLSEEEEAKKKAHGEMTTAERFASDVISTARDTVEQVIDEHMGKYAAKLNAISREFDRLRPWVDIMERQVTDFRKSITERGVAIIIFRGFEEGDYWDYSEYRKAQHRKALFDKWLGEQWGNT